eukprot:1180768-Prorocentrum_minimum.AAC.3
MDPHCGGVRSRDRPGTAHPSDTPERLTRATHPRRHHGPTLRRATHPSDTPERYTRATHPRGHHGPTLRRGEEKGRA